MNLLKAGLLASLFLGTIVLPAVASPVVFKTRKGYYINAYDSTGNVRAQATGNCSNVNVSDEIFTIYKVNGSGRIRNGDKVYLRTRKGYYINAYDSTGNVRAQKTGNIYDINASDEIFTIYFP